MAKITIKEAFQKLSKVTNAGVKNPWFVIRNLGQTFADVADNIEEGGGGGSTVEVTQVLESGTKIATITVDDTPTDLYAPAAYTPINFSTEEQDTGITFVDGKKIYQKTMLVTFPSNIVDGTTKYNTVAHNISNFGSYIRSWISGVNGNEVWGVDDKLYIRTVTFDNTTVSTGSNRASMSDTQAYVTVYYTKTSS